MGISLANRFLPGLDMFVCVILPIGLKYKQHGHACRDALFHVYAKKGRRLRGFVTSFTHEGSFLAGP